MKRKPSPKRPPLRPQIRRTQAADAVAVARIFDGPKVIWGTVQLPFASAEVWQRRLAADSSSGWISLLACVEGEPVGMVGLHSCPDDPRRQHAAELGMAVRDDFQGRGIGTALLRAALDLADGWMQRRRVHLSVYTDNEPGLRLYRAHGFEVEGTQREFAFRAGRYVDAFLMARLRTGRD